VPVDEVNQINPVNKAESSIEDIPQKQRPQVFHQL
jgi:hypothetical protein